MRRDISHAVQRNFNLAELMAFGGITREQADEWVRRSIISAERRPGSGRHRAYSTLNVFEAFLARTLSRYIHRVSLIETVMKRIQQLSQLRHLNFYDTTRPLPMVAFQVMETGKLRWIEPRSWGAVPRVGGAVVQEDERSGAFGPVEIVQIHLETARQYLMQKIL